MSDSIWDWHIDSLGGVEEWDDELLLVYFVFHVPIKFISIFLILKALVIACIYIHENVDFLILKNHIHTQLSSIFLLVEAVETWN